MNGESCFTVQFLRLGEEEGGLGGGVGGSHSRVGIGLPTEIS